MKYSGLTPAQFLAAVRRDYPEAINGNAPTDAEIQASHEFLLAYVEEDGSCPAPVASHEEKSSSGIGNQPNNGPKEWASLTRLLMLSREQSSRIIELEQAIKFLAEQVKTLVDALAEEQEDPDRQVTHYMSGKAI